MTADAAAVDIDEFRLVRVLGHGGMGSVYLGYDTVLERDVAIKVMHDRAEDDDARLRFLTEARAIARLDHPNVIAIFRASTTRAGHPYLVQELVRGDSLDRLALPLPPARTLAIALGIARGLAAAHRRGILHRDVKPANVMIDDDGTPKLLDFGVAKLTRREPGAQRPKIGRAGRAASPSDGAAARARAGMADTTEVGPARGAGPGGASAGTQDHAGPATVGAVAPGTLAGAIVGTPRYMAPEIWRGEPASVRSDLYSLGALLYELATGSAPFPHADRDALEAAVLGGPPPRPIAELAPELDAELADIIMACLAREPAHRPESADEIAHRIERILLGAPPLPDGNPYPGLAPFADEHRAVFYGRGSDVTAIVDRLRSAPLVVVAGDSGIGKSSLCRAGVIPAVLAGALGDRSRAPGRGDPDGVAGGIVRRSWRSRSIVVGRHAAAALRDALSLGDALGDGAVELSVSEVVRATGVTSDSGLVIFLDQFEELVTLNDPAEAAEAAVIIASLARGVPGLKVLIAVRGDFLTRVAALPELGALMTRSLHLLRVLSPADARDAVVGPARAKGVRFETPALVDALASSIAGQPGALPLLSFALAELWQRRDLERAVIPAAALDEIGGVAGGLARHADAVIGALGAAERAQARRIALLLVSHDDTRAERDRRELCPDDDSAAVAALEAMIQGRLVVARQTASGAPIYELAHDSLITAWAQLRGWRDDIAGQRGLRTRLAVAADEWRRLGRPRDALWNRAQLDEAARLDELSAGDRAFLAASRAQVRRRRIGAAVLAASLPAVAIATWLVIQARSAAERDRAVEAHLRVAAEHLEQASAARAEAERSRGDAFARFDAGQPADAEPIWTRAQAELKRARGARADAVTQLEAALLTDSTRGDVRDRLARAIYEQAELAELARDRDAVHAFTTRFAAFDPGGALTAAWHQPAQLVLDAPGAARIDVRRYEDRDGRLVLGPPVASATVPRLTAALPPASYLIELVGGDGLVVRHPVLAARGEELRLDVPLPRAADVPPGMVYVPPGRFLVGAGHGDEAHRRSFLATSPLHPVTTAGYLIAIHEVTFADWMAFLRALPEAERERRRPTGSFNSSQIRLDGGGHPGEPFVLTIQPTTQPYVVREGAPLVYPDRTRRRSVRWEATPVAGISLDDARAYAAWLAATGEVPGARMCSELEWERAARGADGRTWPHGERFDPDDASIDETYGRKPFAYGPDEVGSHPASASPFGLQDTAGNAWEWVESAQGAVLRGGSWWQGSATAAVANRDPTIPTARSTWSGLRICANPKLRR